MNLSINAEYLLRTRTWGCNRTRDESIKLCVDAGFNVLDCSANVWEDDWERDVDAIMNAAAKYGAVIEQSHAPFNFYSRWPSEVFPKFLYRSAEAAVRMGVKNLVFHADEYHPEQGQPFDPEKAADHAYELLAPVIEKAVSGGVKAAIENVYEDHFGVTRKEQAHHCGKNIEELISFIDRFNDPMIGCCWDFGHGKLSFGNNGHVDAINKVGSRIICTHVNDNYELYGKDIHIPPFMGDANWEELMVALKNTGYNGSLTFEMVYGSMPDECVPVFLNRLHNTGIALSEMFEA